MSEKSYAALDANVYTFVVAPDANKIEIRQAVEEIFDVQGHQREHAQPQGQAQAQPPHRHAGASASDQKRAIVSLADGDRIEIFGS